ncbi:MAG: VWA domain-containing protein [Bacillota bacterium]|nr:VWA domain-containing protein [Bacillota bacterium]
MSLLRVRSLADAEFLRQAGLVMAAALEGTRGVHLGEAGVASLKMHTVDPRRPQELHVLTGADAGQVFYHRRRPGEVIHLDVFHQLGAVDHRAVARALARAVDAWAATPGLPWPRESPDRAPGRILDYVDVQTATGGGRCTGSLKYGRRASVRYAHSNHVHIAARIPREMMGLLLYFVAAVEEQVGLSGLEIRRVEKVICDPPAPPGSPDIDLSPYRSLSDSLLREEIPGDRASPEVQASRQLESALELAEELGGVGDLQEALDALAGDDGMRSLAMKLAGSHRSVSRFLDLLEQRGLIRRDGWKVTLTPTGMTLRQMVRERRREIELEFRKLLRRIPAPVPARARVNRRLEGRPEQGRGPAMRPEPVEKGEWARELAVTETVVESVRRGLLAPPPEAVRPSRIVLRPEDVRVWRHRPGNPIDICLLIDASASMAGRRLRAAKFLAQHLVLATRDRVAVLVFQERQVETYVPLCRSYCRVEHGLSRISALGLTPMAEGIMGALEYLRRARARNPVLLLISDGIPTVPKWTLDPLSDALDAANRIPAARVNFACIGLEPNRAFLEGLCRRANGHLYIVDELEKEALVAIAHAERRRVRALTA